MLDDHRRKAVATIGGFGHRASLPSASLPSHPVTLTKRRSRSRMRPIRHCLAPPREGPVAETPQLPVLSRPNYQPDTTHAPGELKVTHAAHTSRVRRPDRPDGG